MPSSTAPESKARRSRITAACAVCRGKRQKCSGEKPVCDQCRLHNEECWWSETKKRGPAKDYLRSLQDRLQETERLLVGTLSRVSDSDLAEVLQSELPGTSSSHQTWASAQSGQDYWGRYPLNRLDTIRAWESNRRFGSHAPSMSQHSEYKLSTETSTTTLPHQEALPSPQTLRTMSVDPTSATTGMPGRPDDYNTFRPEHSRNESWARSEPSGMVLNGRRYSEETREAGEALFSIKNHVRAASQQDYQNHPQQNHDPQQQQQSHPDPPPYSQPWPHQAATAPMQPVSPPKPEPTPPGGFPKHLFW